MKESGMSHFKGFVLLLKKTRKFAKRNKLKSDDIEQAVRRTRA